MSAISQLLQTFTGAEISRFHDAAVAAGHEGRVPADLPLLWSLIASNHTNNRTLWAEEDLARRRDVSDGDIAHNKRAIDGLNQRRNDAVEKIDEELLRLLAPVTPAPDAFLHSETAGAMIDRLSILSLKIFHMGLQLERKDVDAAHLARCGERLGFLTQQRADLQFCFDRLLKNAAAGTMYFKIYRQCKMYNDPTLNPYLSGGRAPK